jgi:N6-adenosine-specific RNA methylase IME4
LRGQTEHALFCTRGNPQVLASSASTVLHARTTGHSRKPDEFYKLAEALTPGRRIDLFGRPRPEWQAWGDRVSTARSNR